MEPGTAENGLLRNGVNTPRTSRKRSAHTILPVKRLRTANIMAAMETRMQSSVRSLEAERNNTAVDRAAVAMSVTTRVTMHIFSDWRLQLCYGVNASGKTADSKRTPSRSLNREGARYGAAVSSRLSELQYTLFAGDALNLCKRQSH